MTSEQGASQAKPLGGLSLYANLLDPTAEDGPGTISRAPVVFQQPSDTSLEDEAAKKKLNSSVLRFQPTKRPQAQKPKPKTTFSAKPQLEQSTSTDDVATTIEAEDASTQPVVSTAADWMNEPDDDDYYAAQTVKRERGGRKRRKKQSKDDGDKQPAEVDWDAIYDPTRPNNYTDYPHSDEQYREMSDWKEYLYSHRERDSVERRYSSDISRDSHDSEDVPRGLNFAPPPSFAPPARFDDDDDDDYNLPPAAANVGDDGNTDARPLPPPQQQPFVPPQDQPAETQSDQPGLGATISRAPVRYADPGPSTASAPPEDEPVTDAPAVSEDAGGLQESSTKPPRKNYGARILGKYGWEKGQGLGASGTGIVTPLQAQVAKRKKLSDALGGGFATPAGHGKIVGGRKSAVVVAEEKARRAKFGEESEVICLQGMLVDLDVTDPEERGELIVEIGEECGDKYGRVERVYIDPETRNVFIKFTAQPSATRALDALEGTTFRGNAITARYWDLARFEGGDYHVS